LFSAEFGRSLSAPSLQAEPDRADGVRWGGLFGLH